jgi:hypothetical protein
MVGDRTVGRVPTLGEFTQGRFGPGQYEVMLIHPCTCQPVKVCFCLPVCPKKVFVSKSRIEFRWGLLCCKAVVVHFLPDGRVHVRG